MNKTIYRETGSTSKVFDYRTLKKDYATLVPVLREGLHVLDVGCGTGAISKDIALEVGMRGSVTGIDNTEAFIQNGRETYKNVSNLNLIHADLFDFEPGKKFDLVVAARVLQWLNNPEEAILKLASFLKPGGQLSVLDYNHEALEWRPEPPESMQIFYQAFLQWRADAGMNNRIAEDLEGYFRKAGLHSIEVLKADEHYEKNQDDFIQRVCIWSAVARLKQISDEGYIADESRLKALDEYQVWTEKDARCMIMKLSEVRGRNSSGGTV